MFFQIRRNLQLGLIFTLPMLIGVGCSFFSFIETDSKPTLPLVTRTIVTISPSDTPILTPKVTETVIASPTASPSSTPTEVFEFTSIESALLPSELTPIRLLNVSMIEGLSGYSIAGFTDFAITPLGDQLAVSTSDYIYIFDLYNGEKNRTLYPEKSGVVDIDFSPDNKWLASASRQGDESEGFTSQVELWNGPYWKPLGVMYESSKGVVKIAFSPDSNHFAAAVTSPEFQKNHVVLINTYQWQIEQIIYKETVLDFGFSADSLMIGTTPNRYTIKVWDIEKKQWVGTFYTSFTGAVNKIAFSPVAPIMASGHYDGFIRLWNIATSELLREIQTGSVVESLSFNKDGTMLVSGGGFENHNIDFWNVETGEKVKTLFGHSNAVTQLTFSPDGRILISASYDGKIILWGIKQ